jgi:osmotically-inducible protein OsmY
MLAVLVLVTAPTYVGAAAGGAAQPTSGEKVEMKAKEAKARISDSWVTAKTKIALFTDDRVKGRQVKVDTTAGVVTLRGTVDSNEAKSAAEQIAQGIKGVQSVKNNLEVVAPSSTKE